MLGTLCFAYNLRSDNIGILAYAARIERMEVAQSCQELLKTCGLEIAEDGRPILHKAGAVFRYELGLALGGDAQRTEQMGEYVEELLADHAHITQYLDPVEMQIVKEGGELDGSMEGGDLDVVAAESMVRLMLGVDGLQTRVAATVVDKLAEFIGAEGAAGDGATKVSVRLLRQLRWLDYVEDAAGLAERLLETLGFAPEEMQREIIAALPDIVADGGAAVGRVLAGMLRAPAGLTLALLEALSGVECAAAELTEARSAVAAQLAAAAATELPAMVRFLLQTATSDTAAATVGLVRRHVDVAAAGTAGELVLHAVAGSVQQQRTVRVAWERAAASADAAGAHTALDLAVLLQLHALPAHARRVERAVQRLVAAGSLTATRVGAVVRQFPGAIGAQFTGLVGVAGRLLQAGGAGVDVAAAALEAAFGVMGAFQRQEIAGALAVHIASGSRAEAAAATNVCVQLAARHPRALRPFAPMLRGLLDGLPADAARGLFDALGRLATHAGSGDDSLFNELHVLVRKRLASVYARHNRVGVVGAVALLRQLGRAGGSTSDDTGDASNQAGTGDSPSPPNQPNSSHAPSNVHALRRAVQLLELLADSGRHRSWAFVALTYDELAHVVETKGLHAQLLAWLHEHVSSAFAERFLADSAGHSAALALDAEEAAVVDIASHSIALPHARLRGPVLACLPAQLRLVQVCEKALRGGSLADIDALLVCGLQLLPNTPDNEDHAALAATLAADDEDAHVELVAALTARPADDRHALCTALFAAANWLREVINAFAGQCASEMRARVVQRVNQLARIERVLSALAASLRGSPEAFRPAATGLIPAADDATAVLPSPGGLALRPVVDSVETSAHLQQPCTVDVDGLQLSQDDARKLVTAAPTVARGRKRKNDSAAAAAADDFARDPHAFLRELNLGAFAVLFHTDEAPPLSAQGLHVLLHELHAAVAAKLTLSAARRTAHTHTPATFGSNTAAASAADVFAQLLQLLPALLRRLDACLDAAPSTATEECSDVLLRIVAAALAWDGLHIPLEDGRTGLRAIMGTLATAGAHTDAAELPSLGAGALARRAFDYLLTLAPRVATSAHALSLLRMLTTVRASAPLHESRVAMRCLPASQRAASMDGCISALALRILAAEEWLAPERLRPADLEFLVAEHIARCPHDPLALACEYAEALPHVLDASNEPPCVAGSTLLTLRRPVTLAPYYKAVTLALATLVRNAHLDAMDGSDLLDFAASVVDCWLGLAKLTQRLTPSLLQRNILVIALRGGLTLTDLFTRQILPLLAHHFLVHRDAAIAVLARMQKSTRILQSICNHSKASRDTRLLSAVPQAKRKLELLIFNVYLLMDKNDCLAAINLGNLKHRDVHGAVVSSQIPREQQFEEEDEDEDDIPMDIEYASDDGDKHLHQNSRKMTPLCSPKSKHSDLVRRRLMLAQRRSAAANASSTVNPENGDEIEEP
ncbi:Fanconi anemia group D2 protein [Coemansia sp. RSA 1365]|nr:Fanconi anemia group D2 protein [Coemansia sp. RSA 1365]